MVKEYIVVSAHSWYDRSATIPDFRERVNEKMQQGYEPIGGIAVYGDGDDFHLYQAMVKERGDE